MLIPTSIPVAAVIAIWPDRPERGYPEMGALVVVSGYVALRWILLGGVVLDSDRIRIHGVLWSRSVPRDRVTGTRGTLLGVRWLTRSGAKRFSPTVCFWTMWDDPGWFEGYNYDIGREIRDWARGRPDWADPRPPGRHL